MFYDHGVSYETHTEEIIRGAEQNPELIDGVAEQLGSRFNAISTLVQLEAPNLFADTHEGSHAHLPLWHRHLRRHCADEHNLLTDSGIDSDTANRDPHLQDLNAIKEGVHRACVSQQVIARREKRRASLNWAAAPL